MNNDVSFATGIYYEVHVQSNFVHSSTISNFVCHEENTRLIVLTIMIGQTKQPLLENIFTLRNTITMCVVTCAPFKNTSPCTRTRFFVIKVIM